MTYVMSDIHGHMERFKKMLEMINFGDEDTLYILGDVIDRNPFGISLLRKIMSMPNVRMLLGNHEYMMLEAFDHSYNGKDYISDETPDEAMRLWYDNGGFITHLSWFLTPEKVRDEIIDYLLSLPLNIDIEVNGVKYKLVHAAPEELYDTYADKSTETKAEFCVWDRDEIFKMPEQDYTLIFGHTPNYLHEEEDTEVKIWYSGKLIDIDCGCGHEGYKNYNCRLACLRLDDMKEFYAE